MDVRVIQMARLLIILASRHRSLVFENLALRQQLAVYRRTRPKPTVWWSDRLLSLLKTPFSLRQLMLQPTMDTLLGDVGPGSLLLTLRTWAHSRAALQLEVLALRHQLQVLQRSRPRRLQLAQADRWLWVMLSRVLTEWRSSSSLRP
jgi:hypothetical protein